MKSRELFRVTMDALCPGCHARVEVVVFVPDLGVKSEGKVIAASNAARAKHEAVCSVLPRARA